MPSLILLLLSRFEHIMTELSKQLLPRLSLPIARLIKALIGLQSAMLISGCLIMATTFFFVVIFRYIFQEDFFAYEEWLLVICFWMYFAGAAIGTYEKSHVTADLLSYIIKDPKIARLRSVIVNLIELIVLCSLTYFSVLMLADEINKYPKWGMTRSMKIPFFVPRLAMLFGFGCMLLYSFLHLILLSQKDIAIPPSEEQTK